MRLRLPTSPQLAALVAVLIYSAGVAIQFTRWQHGQSVNWVLPLCCGFIIVLFYPAYSKVPMPKGPQGQKRLRAVRISPAMAARLTETLWDIGDIVKLIEGWEAVQKP